MSANCGGESPEPGSASSYVDLLNSLQLRAHTLLNELISYQARLRSRNKIQEVEMRVFKRGVESEVKSLDKMRQNLVSLSGHEHNQSNAAEDEETRYLHGLRSSNLPFYEAVWAVAMSSQGVTALGKRMYTKGTTQDAKHDNVTLENATSGLKRATKVGVLVDVVAQNGLEWVKVSTIPERRLLFEMAKEGWETYADSDDEDKTDDIDIDSAERAGKLELVRVAEDLKSASRDVRVRFQHPRIRLVLPNVRENVLPDVDAFLADLRATGAVVQCGTDLQLRGATKEDCDFDPLLPGTVAPFLTDTINIDCTILLALISDISHFSREQLPPVSGGNSYHKAILRQIHAEQSSPLVLSELYPVLRGRALECTSQAAQRMQEIVQCMGTPSERIRADVILAAGLYKGQDAPKLRVAWGEHTTHAVPAEIRFPVKVVDFDTAEFLSSSGRPPSYSEDCALFPASVANRATQMMELSPINTSVFLYGWSRHIVTFTSNRVVATGLLRTINEILDQDEHKEHGGDDASTTFVGPQMYICETARSLIGKTKSTGEQ
ncbi:hypothetical protein A1O1_02895 [Capronia coronata CBS 617.96]|uniref:DUF1308 domain-containing protein n=1 Tax=Capronia coronata CBS 617.96 TaxID=1182541 RepID=W9ZJ27_9EURO|nr:uncharacterized protein A1O1_02895 [Capronia coronata CBS 617.96]EXJ94499.1 hypothetical protein A1O1_02895 [Capronia coronata CBS 617.96]